MLDNSLSASTAHRLDLRTRPPARADVHSALATRQLLLRHFSLSLAHPLNCLHFTDVETEAQRGSVSSRGRAAGAWQSGGLDAPRRPSSLPGAGHDSPRCLEGCLVQSGQVGCSREVHGPDLGAEPFHPPRTSCLILLVWVPHLSCQFSSFLLEKVTAYQGTG